MVDTGSDEQIGGAPPGIVRRMLRLLALAATVVLVLALVGYVTRDRTWWLALLMYLPMPLVALLAIIAQLAAWERGRWKRRASVMVVALAAGLVSVRSMRGTGWIPAPLESLDVVQWNVQWGRDASGWAQTATEIERAVPDILILSEAPSDEKLAHLCARLGDGWTFVVTRNEPRSRYWYAIAVVSRWPLTVQRHVPVPNGAAIAVRVESDDGPVRVLAVDGVSDPLVDRSPMLDALVDQCGEADVIAGDFNAVSRSVGFDRLRAQDFRLASDACWGWRGTYPASLPLYDIDHIWIATRYVPTACVMLGSAGTNHRGQLVNLQRRTLN